MRAEMLKVQLTSGVRAAPSLPQHEGRCGTVVSWSRLCSAASVWSCCDSSHCPLVWCFVFSQYLELEHQSLATKKPEHAGMATSVCTGKAEGSRLFHRTRAGPQVHAEPQLGLTQHPCGEPWLQSVSPCSLYFNVFFLDWLTLKHPFLFL